MPKGIYYRSPERLKELAEIARNLPQIDKYTEESRHRCSLAQMGNKKGLGHKRTKEVKERISAALKDRPSPLKGTKLTEERRIEMSKTQRLRVAQGKHNLWKGGIYPEHKRIRHSVEYKLWREAVFKRDDFTCQFCKMRGGELNADHIQPFAQFPDFRFDIDNGRTLCVPCHRETPTFAGRNRHNK